MLFTNGSIKIIWIDFVEESDTRAIPNKPIKVFFFSFVSVFKKWTLSQKSAQLLLQE